MRTALTILGTATVLTLGPLAAGCSAHPTGFGDEGLSSATRLSKAHLMPMRRPGDDPNKPKSSIVAAAKNQASTGGAQLTYRGGPLLQSVKIQVVFWGQGVDSTVQSGIGGYYADITNSPYFDWLNEYAANGQTIGRGSLGGAYTITPSTGSQGVDDSQIGPELDAQIKAGKLPANDGNTLYMVYFPPGLNITMGGSSSCVTFCAYHSTLQRSDGSNLYYGVMPDLGGACAGGCGGGSLFQSTTQVSSHEMIEAVTDPAVGINVLSWYDDTNGEIGDICNDQPGTVDGYQVQLEWSNKNGQCIATDPNGGGSSSSSGGGGSSSSSGSSGGGGSSGSSSGTGSSSGGGSSSGSGGGSGSSSSSGSSGGGSGSSSGSGGGGGTCSVSEQEPNDWADYADDLSGGCLGGNLDPAGDVDYAAFQLSDGQDYDVVLAPSGDGNVVLYKWVGGDWAQVQSTSATEIHHTSQGGGYYLTITYSPSNAVQSYNLTLTVQ